MNRLCAALIGLLLASAAQAQQVVNPQPNAGNYGAYNVVAPTCITGTGCWLQTDINGQLKITGTVTVTPSGTQNVNLTQILSAAPSLTNPIWVFPATGATFPVSGTVATTTADVANLATAQVSVTTGNISVAALRTGRRAVTITNATGTSAIYCGNTGVSTTTGTYLAGTLGSSITLNGTFAVFCTVAATTQTVTVAETF